jgi:predicted dehydrogenase
MLDTDHGADYFRRWHRKKENSGGLLVHKSTHHFDMVNWLINDEPAVINAFGSRRFYGPVRKETGERCLTCPHKETCEFYFDIKKSNLNREFYYECEDADGYFRDRCVFADEINIEDTVSVSVAYTKGAVMSYSLTAHSPYEGYRIALNGTKGRIEAEDFHGGIGPYMGKHITNLRLYNRMGEEIDIKIPPATGAHGGGDARLLEMLFREGQADPLGHMADTRAGIMSAIIGIAANKSMKENRSVNVNDLLPDII